MEEFYDKLVSFIKQENEMIRKEISELNQKVEDIRQELKQEIESVRKELKQEIEESRQELKQEIESVRQELKQEIEEARQEFKNKMIIFEDYYGRKIDGTYEFVKLQNELLKEKFDDIRGLDQRVQRNEMEIFNHENRICDLEKVKC